MSLLNEFKVCLYENKLITLVPTGTQGEKPTGKTEIDARYVSSYEEAVRDCNEHPSVDNAIDSVYKGLRKVDLMPYTDTGDAWGGSFKNGLDVGEGGVATIYLRQDGKVVTNAYLKVDLYKNSSGEYEVSSNIEMK